MNSLEMIQLQPFAEVAGGTYRFGYRLAGVNDCISTIEVPSQIVEQVVLPRGSLALRMGPDGTVFPPLSYAANKNLDLPTDIEALDVLVQRAVDTESLRMEEATISDLNTLLQRLECSIGLVKDAISQIQAAQSIPSDD